MAKVALTEQQKMRDSTESICKSVIDAILYTFTVKKRLKKAETAEALGLSTNTWYNWRSDSLLNRASFRDVANALYKAGYQLKIEERK